LYTGAATDHRTERQTDRVISEYVSSSSLPSYMIGIASRHSIATGVRSDLKSIPKIYVHILTVLHQMITISGAEGRGEKCNVMHYLLLLKNENDATNMHVM
jgi:hypothetical protein